MTPKQQLLINDLVDSLPKEEKNVYIKIIDYFIELGYIPQKNRSYISFKNKLNEKIIAKINKSGLKIKFFASKGIPQKLIDALRIEMEINEGQYNIAVPAPDTTPLPEGIIIKKCTLLCNVCTGGNMRYYYRFPDGKEIFRCGAYPVLIPEIKEEDINDLKRIILEQHNYFLSITYLFYTIGKRI